MPQCRREASNKRHNLPESGLLDTMSCCWQRRQSPASSSGAKGPPLLRDAATQDFALCSLPAAGLDRVPGHGGGAEWLRNCRWRSPTSTFIKDFCAIASIELQAGLKLRIPLQCSDLDVSAAGATIQAVPSSPRPSALNISMNIFDGEIASGGIAGVRLDLPAIVQHQSPTSYTQLTSYFFYQSGTSVGLASLQQ